MRATDILVGRGQRKGKGEEGKKDDDGRFSSRDIYAADFSRGSGIKKLFINLP